MPLFAIENGGLKLKQSALQLIKQINSGSVYLVTMVGEPSLLYRKMYKMRNLEPTDGVGIYMANTPRYS